MADGTVVLTINFQGVGNGTARITVDYTCTFPKPCDREWLPYLNVTVGDGWLHLTRLKTGMRRQRSDKLPDQALLHCASRVLVGA